MCNGALCNYAAPYFSTFSIGIEFWKQKHPSKKYKEIHYFFTGCGSIRPQIRSADLKKNLILSGTIKILPKY
jgi:hypothetical protein